MRRMERLLGKGNEGTRGRQIVSLLCLMVFLPSQAFQIGSVGPTLSLDLRAIACIGQL